MREVRGGGPRHLEIAADLRRQRTTSRAKHTSGRDDGFARVTAISESTGNTQRRLVEGHDRVSARKQQQSKRRRPSQVRDLTRRA